MSQFLLNLILIFLSNIFYVFMYLLEIYKKYDILRKWVCISMNFLIINEYTHRIIHHLLMDYFSKSNLQYKEKLNHLIFSTKENLVHLIFGTKKN